MAQGLLVDLSVCFTDEREMAIKMQFSTFTRAFIVSTCDSRPVAASEYESSCLTAVWKQRLLLVVSVVTVSLCTRSYTVQYKQTPQ